jgi:hypothetical protein
LPVTGHAIVVVNLVDGFDWQTDTLKNMVQSHA